MSGCSCSAEGTGRRHRGQWSLHPRRTTRGRCRPAATVHRHPAVGALLSARSQQAEIRGEHAAGPSAASTFTTARASRAAEDCLASRGNSLAACPEPIGCASRRIQHCSLEPRFRSVTTLPPCAGSVLQSADRRAPGSSVAPNTGVDASLANTGAPPPRIESPASVSARACTSVAVSSTATIALHQVQLRGRIRTTTSCLTPGLRVAVSAAG